MCDKAVDRNPWQLKDVPYQIKTEKMCKRVVEKNLWYLGHVPDQYKTEGMYNKAVCILPYDLGHIPDDHFKGLMKQGIKTCDGMTYCSLCMMFFVPERLTTQEMCNRAVCMDPYSLEFVPDHFKTEEMCNEAMRWEPYTPRYVPDHLKTQEMCNKALRIIFSDAKDICNEAVGLSS